MNKVDIHKFDSIRPGMQVTYRDEDYVVLQYIDLNYALCKGMKTNVMETILIKSLQIPLTQSKEDLLHIKDQDWQTAQQRFEIIKPLIDGTIMRTADTVAIRAAENKVSSATIYRWINVYQDTGLISSLIPRQRLDKGKNRVTSEAQKVIDFYIEREYLTSQKPLMSKIINKIILECKDKAIDIPHPNTIRNIINKIPDELRLRKRFGKEVVNTYKPIRGHFPGADWPLAVIQIDHSKLDVILVDDVYRRPIGRPFLTIAIDVYSRVIAGYYLSFDAPGAFSVGMCIANAILPKEPVLISHDIKGEWPVFGLMKTIHVDNGKDFRSAAFERSCAEYGIEILWRPVRVPHYGGHIERFFGTLEGEIHNIPGTTFSNTKDRANYDSETKAALTISEFESWLIHYITGVYHQNEHSELGMAPIKKYEIGIIGDDNTLGRGLSFKTYDETKLKLDFMPFFERTIQAYGTVFMEIEYYHDVLRRWINAKELDNPKLKRKFIFKYDPRDISAVFFYDPELKTYYRIPYRDISHPIISIWELRNIKKHLSENKLPIDEHQIFATYQKLTLIVQEASSKTKKARKQVQIKSEHKKKVQPILAEATSTATVPADTIQNGTSFNNEDIQPFDDIIE